MTSNNTPITLTVTAKQRLVILDTILHATHDAAVAVCAAKEDEVSAALAIMRDLRETFDCIVGQPIRN